MGASMQGISSASCGSAKPLATTIHEGTAPSLCRFYPVARFGNLGERGLLPAWFAGATRGGRAWFEWWQRHQALPRSAIAPWGQQPGWGSAVLLYRPMLKRPRLLHLLLLRKACKCLA